MCQFSKCEWRGSTWSRLPVNELNQHETWVMNLYRLHVESPLSGSRWNRRISWKPWKDSARQHQLRGTSTMISWKNTCLLGPFLRSGRFSNHLFKYTSVRTVLCIALCFYVIHVNCSFPPLDPVCGGISEGWSDLTGEHQAAQEEMGGEEGQKAHWGVDIHGLCYGWNPRRTNFYCFLSGTARQIWITHVWLESY